MFKLNSQLKGYILIICSQKHTSSIRNNWTFNILELLKVSKLCSLFLEGRSKYAIIQAITALPHTLQMKSQYYTLKQSSWLLCQPVFLSEHISALFTVVQLFAWAMYFICVSDHLVIYQKHVVLAIFLSP